jgi:hypothetical protein
MHEILLCTLNATYQHCAFGLRYLYANLAEFKAKSKIFEFTINQNPRDIAAQILSQNPKIVGFGVYIWNTEETLLVLQILKRVRPDLIIVLGGPEVTHETTNQEITKWCDHVIQGEADLLFYEFCQKVYSGEKPPAIISGPLPDLQKIKSPYADYTDEDIRNRIVYVEASRGCPYKCEYCLSSLDKSVRNFDLDYFLNELQSLIDRGVREFKFVDRTFNLSPSISTSILKFFLERIQHGLFLHFEMVPDRLPDELKELIQKFPQGSLQFEIGIQTFNTAVAAHVSRRQNYQKIEENLHYLKNRTRVHTHADLIVGLPGESFESFAKGFDTLVSLQPDEIQVGVLKRLKGFPLARHDQNFKMIYELSPPYQIVQTQDMSFEQIQKLSRFAKHWDLIGNSGHFGHTLKTWKEKIHSEQTSFFESFFELSLSLNKKFPHAYGISLAHLFEGVYEHLKTQSLWTENEVIEHLQVDYARKNGRNPLPFFRNHSENLKAASVDIVGRKLDRQKNHLMTHS